MLAATGTASKLDLGGPGTCVKEMTESFSSTYREAREKFLAASHAAGAEVFSYGRSDIAGKDGELLVDRI